MENQPSKTPSKHKSILTFFVLVFLMSAVFWLLGAVTDQALPEETSVDLPISSLMGVCPIIAGLILVHRENGIDGVKSLLKRAFDYKRIKMRIWYLPTLLLMPVTVFWVNGLQHGRSIAVPEHQNLVLMVVISTLLYFIEALTEEVGWQGYVFEPMLARWDALTTSTILGVVWAAWHIIPFIQTHQSTNWIAWQAANLVVTRILITWIYNNTGKSVFAAILYHTMNNVSTVLLPMFGLIYDPAVTTITLSAVALIVIFLWGPKTLSSYRFKKSKIGVQNPSRSL